MILGKKERKDMIMNKTEQLIQAETTLHLIDKLVKKIHKEYPTALITETWEIQNLIKDYKDEV
jgi:hypothetical protein